MSQEIQDQNRSPLPSAKISEGLLKRFAHASPDLLLVCEADSGRVRMVSAGFERICACAAEEIVGRTLDAAGIWPQAGEFFALVGRLRAAERQSEIRLQWRARDDRELTVLGHATLIDDANGDLLVLSMRDETDKARALLEYEAILANAQVGIALTRERIIRRVNARFEQIFGWEKEGLTGRSGEVLWPSHEAFREVGRFAAPRLAAAQPVDFERAMQRRDGTRIWCRVRAKAIDAERPRDGTIWIVEDVTDLRRSEAALENARREAESASRAKSAFLANMSHEIRTPLNAIVGLARLAMAPGTRLAQQREHLRRILDSAEALQELISGVLDLSKIEAGKLDIEDSVFDLHDLLGGVYTAYAPIGESKGLRVHAAIDPGVPRWVRGDPVRVRQIVGNYLGNALKFTEHGSVELRTVVGSEMHVLIEVRDTGIGIDAATQRRLFTAFTQADESTTREYGGTGLGLAICRELARLMGGEVGVRSAVGQGSCFWVELPLSAAPMPASADETPDPGLLAGVRVLLVEDNPMNLLVAETLLGQWGMSVTTAEDGLTAVNLVRANPQAFDVVLMDVHMPGMDGIEATRLLRKEFSAQRLPIIAQTAAVMTSEREQCLEAGMNDFVSKPIDVHRLFEVLRGLVATGAG